MALYKKVDTNLNFANREKEVENFWAEIKSPTKQFLSAKVAKIILSMTVRRLPTVSRTSDTF